MPVYYPAKMLPKKTMAEEWRSYEDNVVPANASLAQRENARNAFYAGAVSLMTLIHRIMGPGGEPTDTEVQRMDALQNELNAFIDRLKGGHQ